MGGKHTTQTAWLSAWGKRGTISRTANQGPCPPGESSGEGSFPKGGDSLRECHLDMALARPNLLWLLQHQTYKQWEHGVSPTFIPQFLWAHRQNILQGCTKHAPVPPAPEGEGRALQSSPSAGLLSLHQSLEKKCGKHSPTHITRETEAQKWFNICLWISML